MKSKITTLILLPLMLMFWACQKQKDACANTLCLNNGVCVDGTCQCPAGFSGKNCEVKDLCYGVSCKNGGVCASGNCNCPTGFGGADCSQQLTPTAIRIKEVIVTGYPRTKTSGADWDVARGSDLAEPDMYPVIGNYTRGTTLWVCPDILLDVNKYNLMPNFSFKPATPVSLANLNEQYSVSLYDYDSPTSSEFMSGLRFTPSQFISGNPKEITIDCVGCSMSFKLVIDYVY